MSLKAFHVLFIIATFLLCVGTGAWLIGQYRTAGGGLLELTVGIASLLGAGGVVAYFFWFVRKLKGVSYI